MAESNKNNVANVSSAKGVKGGYIFTAPAGTALPTDYKTALPEAEITVDAACTASFDPKANTEALDSMESIQINVINRKDK